MVTLLLLEGTEKSISYLSIHSTPMFQLVALQFNVISLSFKQISFVFKITSQASLQDRYKLQKALASRLGFLTDAQQRTQLTLSSKFG